MKINPQLLPELPIQFKSGTMVKTINGDATNLFTLNELKTMFGVSSANTYNFFVLVNNGDGNANGKHFDNCTWLGTTLYMVMNGSVNTSTRINYLIFYLP